MSSRGRIAVSVSNTVTLSLRLVTLYKSYRSHGSDGKGVDLLRTVWINIHAATREQRPVSNEKVIHVMIKVGTETFFRKTGMRLLEMQILELNHLKEPGPMRIPLRTRYSG
jgi:hypothetical protein